MSGIMSTLVSTLRKSSTGVDLGSLLALGCLLQPLPKPQDPVKPLPSSPLLHQMSAATAAEAAGDLEPAVAAVPELQPAAASWVSASSCIQPIILPTCSLLLQGAEAVR